MCKIVSFDRVNRLNYKITTFRKLDCFCNLIKRGKGKEELAVGLLIEITSDLKQNPAFGTS